MSTKKLPVAISFGDYKTTAGEFLIPPLDGIMDGFQGLKSGKRRRYGALSYLGREITMNDVFAKLVDSGQRIEDVSRTLEMLTAYLEMLQDFKIGNIIGIEASDEADYGFRLVKVANRPPTEGAKLP